MYKGRIKASCITSHLDFNYHLFKVAFNTTLALILLHKNTQHLSGDFNGDYSFSAQLADNDTMLSRVFSS